MVASLGYRALDASPQQQPASAREAVALVGDHPFGTLAWLTGAVDAEEVLDDPEQVFDLCLVACLFRVASRSSTLPPGRIL